MSNSPAEKLLNKLENLSPFLSLDFLLHNKINGIRKADYPQPPPFMFYRCFVGYYHWMVGQNLDNSSLKPLADKLAKKQFQGHCVGDAHMENFGVIFNNQDKDKAIFTMNDGDDGGIGPLFVDVLRFFGAVKLNNDNDNLSPIIEAYQEGVRGKKRKNCVTIEAMIKDSVKDEAKEKCKDYRTKFEKQVKSKAQADNGYNKHKTGLTQWEIKEVKRILDDQFGKEVTFIDAFTYVKVVGGSGGLRRVRVLVDFKSDKNPKRPNSAGCGILELKELTTPGIYQGVYMSPKEVGKCISSNLVFENNEILGKFFAMTQFDEQPYELRPRWNCYAGVALEDLKTDKQRMEVMANEAYILGTIHRRGANHPKQYAKAVGGVSNKEWKKAASFVQKQVTADFKAMVKLSKIKPVKAP